MVHNEKSPLWRRALVGKTACGGRVLLVFINLFEAGDYMAKYSNVSTQKQRVLHD